MIRGERAGIAMATASLMLVMLVVIPSCSVARPGSTPSSTAAPSNRVPAFPAMAYYETNCSRCHGPEGSFYGPTLGKNLTDTQLIKVVNDMADGPGGAPLKPEALAVETALHRAMVLHVPFVSVTSIDGGKWSGEVMSDSKVTLMAGEEKIVAVVAGAAWTAQLPEATKPTDVRIVAELDGRTTFLRLSESSYSNRTALAPPDKR